MSLFAYGNTVRCEPKLLEDSVLVTNVGKYIILMVADGNGSTAGNINTGSITTTLAADWLRHGLLDNNGVEKNLTTDEIGDILNSTLFGLSRTFIAINALDEKYTPVYVSLSICIIDDLSLDMVCGSVGNCEIHRVRNGEDEVLNFVHSEAFESYKKHDITEDEWRSSPKRGLLTSSLGQNDDPKFDVFVQKLRPDDILIVTTDGLLHVTTPQGILEEAFSNSDDIRKATDAVLQKAVDNQCPDNCGLIIGYIHDDVKGRETTSSQNYRQQQGSQQQYRSSLGEANEPHNARQANMSNQRQQRPQGYSQRQPQGQSRQNYQEPRRRRRG